MFVEEGERESQRPKYVDEVMGWDFNNGATMFMTKQVVAALIAALP